MGGEKEANFSTLGFEGIDFYFYFFFAVSEARYFVRKRAREPFRYRQSSTTAHFKNVLETNLIRMRTVQSTKPQRSHGVGFFPHTLLTLLLIVKVWLAAQRLLCQVGEH